MTIGDCSCYWDIKQTYFVLSLSAQILYFFYLSQAFAKKKQEFVFTFIGAPWPSF